MYSLDASGSCARCFDTSKLRKAAHVYFTGTGPLWKNGRALPRELWSVSGDTCIGHLNCFMGATWIKTTKAMLPNLHSTSLDVVGKS